MIHSACSPVRCGIILAAGEGKRLESFIQQVEGERLPKQYVDFLGTGSMLEHTFRRAEKLIPPEQIFTVVGRDHLKYPKVWRRLSQRPYGSSVILQPENKETGPGLLLPLLHLLKCYPDSVVAIFPSDHFIAEEDLFMDHVEMAFQVVEQYSNLLVLLGMKPHAPEADYGYIIPGESPYPVFTRLRKITQFIEKPEPQSAEELVQNGALWNTFVMVFRTATMLDLIRMAVPSLFIPFEPIRKVLGTPEEMGVVETVYRDLEPLNFSKGILECLANRSGSHLAVLQVEGVFWSDWGTEDRIINDLRRFAYMGRSDNALKWI